MFDLRFRGDLVDHGFEFLVFECGMIDPYEVAVNPQHWRIIGRKMKVGRLLFRHQFKESVYASHAVPGLEQLN